MQCDYGWYRILSLRVRAGRQKPARRPYPSLAQYLGCSEHAHAGGGLLRRHPEISEIERSDSLCCSAFTRQRGPSYSERQRRFGACPHS